MINVELSGVWNCISLPDLLGRESELFDAHLYLRSNQPEKPGFLGFLGQSDSLTARMLHSVERAAEDIRAQADTLVVVGNCGAADAARAALRLFAQASGVTVLFTGDHLSSRRFLQLCDRLEGHDFCMHLICPAGGCEELLASRALRWMLERRYGQSAAKHIFVSAPADSAAARMAQEEQYTLLPMPSEPGGLWSGLTSAAFLPMAAAGPEPLSVLEGAAEAYSAYDLRAFENPVWMYVGARQCLLERGRSTELLGTFEPDMEPFGRWWRRYFTRHALPGGSGCLPVHVPFWQDADLLDAPVCAGRSDLFETYLRVPSMARRRVNVEMDWRDYDGLGYLAGRTLQDVEQASFAALLESRDDAGAPAVVLETEEMTPGVLGELLYFFELAGALSGALCGADPFEQPPLPTRILAKNALENL